jgi:hypothetical protein
MVFILVALVHLLRLFYHWEVVVAGQVIPMSASTVGMVVTFILALWMFLAASRN